MRAVTRAARRARPRAVGKWLALVVSCVLLPSASALAEFAGDSCKVPELRIESWHNVTPIGGVTIALPPNFVSAPTTSHNRRSVFFSGGRDRSVGVGTGSGPGGRLNAGSGMGTTSQVEKLPDGSTSDSYAAASDQPSGQMNQTARCTTTIGGRVVEITEYKWSAPVTFTSQNGEPSSLYRAVARFRKTASQPEVFISLDSGAQSDIGAFSAIFWTASFTSPAAASVGAAPTPACVATPNPNLPALDAVLDTALVQMLVANAAPPIPHGFEVMSLRFDDSGGVAGISVSQSDLPDSTQRQLTTLVASNLKQHDSKAPSTFLLRVDAKDTGLRYSVQSDCTQ